MAPRAQQANRVTEISCATAPQKSPESLLNSDDSIVAYCMVSNTGKIGD